MRQILGQSATDEQGALRVVDAFDDAMSRSCDLADLVALARDLTGHDVGIRDEWNGRFVAAGAAPPADGEAIAHAAVVHGVRGRDARTIEMEGGLVLVAAVEVAAGRIGICWMNNTRAAEQYLPIDFLVVERLARTVSQRALQEHSTRDAIARVEENAIERLLESVPSELVLAEIARTAGLPIERDYVCIAVAASPVNSLGTTVLAAEMRRRLGGSGHAVKTTALRRCVAALCTSGDSIAAVVDLAAAHFAKLGVAVVAGVSQPMPLRDASFAWRQASEALALHSIANSGGAIAFFDDLGALALLTGITENHLMVSALYRKMIDVLPDSRSPSNLELLEVFLDEASLRKTATKVFLHHTTVEGRLRRIESLLGVDLADHRVRFELQLLLKAARVAKYTGAL